MSTTTTGRPRGRSGPEVRAVRPQLRLLGGTALVGIGAFLPWVDTALGDVPGIRGAGLWTFYAAFLGLAGAVVRVRVLVLVQAALLAGAALALPLWQLVHLWTLVGGEGWRPGPGLVLTLLGGVLAAAAVRDVLRAGGGAAQA